MKKVIEYFSKSDNLLLFLAEWISLVKDKQKYRQEIVTLVESLEVVPGLYNRVPNGRKVEQHDNYVGLQFLDTIYDIGWSQDILDYGSKHGFNYNNRDRDKWELKTQRQPGEITWYRLCAGETATPWGSALLAGGIVSATFNKGSSVPLLTWLRIMTLDNLDRHTTLTKIASWIFRARAQRFERLLARYHRKGPIREMLTK